MARKLQMCEIILYNYNVVTMLQVEHPKITPEAVQKALLLERFEHPYLRHVINSYQFEEKLDQTYDVEFEIAEVHGDMWKQRMQEWGGRARDHSKSLIHTKLVSDSQKIHHEIYFVLNHAGCDGIGAFTLVESFLEYLSDVLEHNGNMDEIPKPISRPFQDIISSINIEESLKIKLPPVPNYVPSLTGDQNIKPQSPFTPCLSIHSQLDEQTTANLIAQCRKHKATIQSALSVAGMIQVAYAQREKYPLPQTFCNQVPINMRKHVDKPFDQKDILCGSSTLFWPQKLDAGDSVWKHVTEAYAAMQNDIAEKKPIGWWGRIAAAKWEDIRPHSVANTSVGVTNIKKTYGKDNSLKVSNFRLVAAKFETPDDLTADRIWLVSHAQTTLNCLNLSFTCSSRFFSQPYAEKLASIEHKVMKLLSDPNNENITVKDILDSL